jgi:hypothetical protein
MEKAVVKIRELFFARVIARPRCWFWIGSKDKNGYGTMTYSPTRKVFKAHRVSYEIFKGPIPDGLHVRHSCDHPWCVNPQHLLVGTHKENMRDVMIRGRHHNKRKTHCIRGHELAGENLMVSKNGKRFCRVCWRKSNLAGHHRRKGLLE